MEENFVVEIQSQVLSVRTVNDESSQESIDEQEHYLILGQNEVRSRVWWWYWQVLLKVISALRCYSSSGKGVGFNVIQSLLAKSLEQWVDHKLVVSVTQRNASDWLESNFKI